MRVRIAFNSGDLFLVRVRPDRGGSFWYVIKGDRQLYEGNLRRAVQRAARLRDERPSEFASCLPADVREWYLEAEAHYNEEMADEAREEEP